MYAFSDKLLLLEREILQALQALDGHSSPVNKTSTLIRQHDVVHVIVVFVTPAM